MPTFRPTTSFIPQFFLVDGAPNEGGSIEAFISGTTTRTAMFTDEAGTTAGDTVTLNAAGRPETSGNEHQIWIDTSIRYDFVVNDAAGVQVNNPQNVFSPVLGTLSSFPTIAEATASAVLDDGQEIYIRGSGNYYYDQSSSIAANGGTILALDTLPGRLIYTDDMISPDLFGAVGDGVANDDTAFANLEAAVSGEAVDLLGKTYLVSTIPDGNIYLNGYFALASVNYPASFDLDGVGIAEAEGGDNSTGALLPAVSGTTVFNVSGRSNNRSLLVMASTNCLSGFTRSVNVGSIHSHAKGNVSGNYSSRLSLAFAPQSVNLGCEESEIYGFRGAGIAAHFSQAEQDSNFNLGTRFCSASGKASGNIATVSCHSGQGNGARFTPTIVANAVDSVAVDVGGENYIVGQPLVFFDRSGPGTGADYTISTVDGSGSILGLTKNSGGANYSDIVDAVVDCAGDYSANIASTNECKTMAEAAINAGSNNSRAGGVRSGNFATNNCETSGFYSANIAANTCNATSNLSANIVASGCDASGNLSACFVANNSRVEADEAAVMGRRTVNNVNRSLAAGNSAAGAADTANRTFHLFFETGNINHAGTISSGSVFTDYAEFFENLNLGEIPLGVPVSLQGDKVKPWVPGDFLLGVISDTGAIRAGDTSFHWQGRYLTGDFGELLFDEIPDPDYIAMVPDPDWFKPNDMTEDDRPLIANPKPQKTVKVKRENPSYDPSLANLPRSERPDEWSCVGLLGQLYTRLPSGVQVGDTYADRLRVMAITKPFNGDYKIGRCLLV